nr:GNAT family N-acetyltransferase [uncultured Lacibacter sp.]
MLTLRQVKSIHDIDPQHWNSIVREQDVFHRHNFIRIVEDSKVEDAGFYYLLFYHDEKLVATTILSVFSFNLDLFISDNFFVQWIKKISPGFFKIKLLVCGLPASFGQLNLALTDNMYAAEVCSLITGKMKMLAKELNISLMAVKEFRQAEHQYFRQFEREGFFSANSIPYMNLEIKWKSFAEYLSALRHPYRRKIILSLKKIQQSYPVITREAEYRKNNTMPALVLSEPDEDFARLFYKLYLAVMDRTATKLEVLNYAFFRNIFQQQNEYKILSLVVKGEVISAAVLIFTEDTLIFMLAGREHEKDKYDSYFNLIYGIIALAIERGCREIKMGQTSYWVKQCVGAMAEPELIYFASRRPVIHWVLKHMRHIIFPATKLKEIDIFRKAAHLSKHMEPPVHEKQCQPLV